MQVQTLMFVLIAFAIVQLIGSSFAGYGADNRETVSGGRCYGIVQKAKDILNKCSGKYVCKQDPSIFNWRGGSKCIEMNQICDNRKDCRLGDDELNCGCPALPRPRNGDVSTENVATYTCDEGYNTEEATLMIRTCTADSRRGWTGEEPECIKSPCLNGWTHNENSCYKAEFPQTWDEAKINCGQLNANAHLVDIGSPEEADFIAAQFNSPIGMHIGLNDKAIEGLFVWSDNTTVPVEMEYNWGEGEPNNFNSDNEDCVFYRSSKWNDMLCSRTIISLCEYELE